MYAQCDWSKVTDEDLVDALVRAAADGNEYDNRAAIEDAKREVLRRLAFRW